jgi:hypothetical protein
MLIIGLFVIFLALIICGIVGLKKVISSDKDANWIMIVVGGVCLFGLIVCLAENYISSTTEIARLDVFRNYNVQNYAVIVSETEAILSAKEFSVVLIEGSVEKTQVGIELTARLIEWREAVNTYNNRVATLRACRSSWVLGGVLAIPPVPDDLVSLIISR